MTQAVAEVEVFSEVISASTPKHTTHKKKPQLNVAFYLPSVKSFDTYLKSSV